MNQGMRIKRYGLCWTSLVAQWVRLHASTAGGRGSISRGKGKISHAMAKKKVCPLQCAQFPHSGDVSGMRVRCSLVCTRRQSAELRMGTTSICLWCFSFGSRVELLWKNTASGVNTLPIRKIHLRRPGSRRQVNKSSNLSVLLPCSSTPK